MCMSPFECLQTGFEDGKCKALFKQNCDRRHGLETEESRSHRGKQKWKAEMATKLMTEDRLKLHSNKAKCKQNGKILRGTQRHFSENICSEDNLRSRIFGKFFVKFLACLPASPRIFEHLKKWYNCPFLTDFYPKNVT